MFVEGDDGVSRLTYCVPAKSAVWFQKFFLWMEKADAVRAAKPPRALGKEMHSTNSYLPLHDFAMRAYADYAKLSKLRAVRQPKPKSDSTSMDDGEDDGTARDHPAGAEDDAENNGGATPPGISSVDLNALMKHAANGDQADGPVGDNAPPPAQKRRRRRKAVDVDAARQSVMAQVETLRQLLSQDSSALQIIDSMVNTVDTVFTSAKEFIEEEGEE